MTYYTTHSRWMYWTNYGAVDTIERASMDGTARGILHNDMLRSPFGIALDYESQTLYWIDARLGYLESSRADGSNRSSLTGVLSPCAYGITYFEQTVYWGDWCQHAVMSVSVNASVDSSNSSTVVVSTGGSDPYRIHVVSEQRQPVAG